jgi:hypothetical protein
MRAFALGYLAGAGTVWAVLYGFYLALAARDRRTDAAAAGAWWLPPAFTDHAREPDYGFIGQVEEKAYNLSTAGYGYAIRNHLRRPDQDWRPIARTLVSVRASLAAHR